ncbi:MAG: hypothetical protein A3F09_03885 [Chlamydiae bacterium RIFCSPHIGHO2_12_FULL_49_11]|nr:MAG: hypothetical protein A3F09_03885 [Chlamydiae bacterium RIFCSPHIGHO2_12_FULL_49_11]
MSSSSVSTRSSMSTSSEPVTRTIINPYRTKKFELEFETAFDKIIYEMTPARYSGRRLIDALQSKFTARHISACSLRGRIWQKSIQELIEKENEKEQALALECKELFTPPKWAQYFVETHMVYPPYLARVRKERLAKMCLLYIEKLEVERQFDEIVQQVNDRIDPPTAHWHECGPYFEEKRIEEIAKAVWNHCADEKMTATARKMWDHLLKPLLAQKQAIFAPDMAELEQYFKCRYREFLAQK